MPFAPTIDGKVLPCRAIDAVAEGSAAGVPLFTGTTRDEWRLFTAASTNLRSLDEAGLRKLTARLVGEERADTLVTAYDAGTPFDRWNDVMTDHSFFVPATRLLDAQGPHALTYAYRFDWPSPAMGGILGACHALELGFTFGTYRLKGAEPFFGAGPEADALAEAMMDSWIAFARNGNPSNDSAGAFMRYDATKRATTIFGDGAPHVTSAPNEARRTAWEAVPAERIGP